MAYSPIITPRGSIIVEKSTMKAVLKWNPGFGPKLTSEIRSAQGWLDNEVLENCEPFVPLLTGMLVKSGILGTEIGSGKVIWIAPYARAQYYSARQPGSLTGPDRGPYWFERAKARFLTHWKAGVKRAIKRFGKV